MFFNDCLHLSSLFLLISLFTKCKETPKNTESAKVSIDTSNVIRRILEIDEKKKLDTIKLVYKLGDTGEFIQGEIISRGKGPMHPDTVKLTRDDSNHYSVFVPNGSRLRLTFGDRKRIWLNSGTTLTFAGMIKKSRWIQLKGEACFDVKQTNDPFIVETKAHKIFLNKGKMNLNTFDSLKNYASLMGGVVILYGIDGQKIIELTGDKAITFGSNILEKRNADPSIVNSWTRGFLAHDQTLYIKTYFDALGRWYDVDVKMPTRSLSFGWDGRFPLESNLKSILDVFQFNEVKYKLKLNDKRKLELYIL